MKSAFLKVTVISLGAVIAVFFIACHSQAETQSPAVAQSTLDEAFKQAEDEPVSCKNKEENSKDLRNQVTLLTRKKMSLENDLSALKKINAQLEQKAAELYLKAQELDQVKKEYESLKPLTEKLNTSRTELTKQNQALREQLNTLNTGVVKERGTIYQEMGTAYAEAKYYDLAIKAYQKSLEANAANAPVYYNLGLLYKYSKDNIPKALECFKKYVELNPQAENRKDADYWIKMLSEQQNEQ